MTEPVENLYFEWLCNKVLHLENPTPSLTYWTLLRALHGTEYVWLLSGDDNRSEDGLELREEFLHESRLPYPDEWDHTPCSVLEMLIAFSRRAEFMTLDTAQDWFWEFIDNLGLLECNDASGVTPEEIGEQIHSFIWRTYDYSGRGGLFPMNRAPQDQRQTEVWYQFCEYLVDQDREL